MDCNVLTGGIGMVDFCNGHADDAGVTCQERKNSLFVFNSFGFRLAKS